MRKTVIAPGQGTIESDELDEPQISLAVATHHDDCTRVEVNGLVYPSDDIEEQSRQCLGLVEKMLDDLDGSMRDLVKLRWYVLEDVHGPETRGAIQEAQAAFVDRPHYPASCMIGVADVGAGAATIELDASATIPRDGWTVETITGDE